jgi:hypothetical protein
LSILTNFLFALDELLGLQLSFCGSQQFLALNLFGFLDSLESLLLQEPFLFFDANLELSLDFLLCEELLAFLLVIVGNYFLLREGCSGDLGLSVNLLFLELLLFES